VRAQNGLGYRGWISPGITCLWETVRISLIDAYKIRRIYGRLAKMRGRVSLCRLTVFTRYENVLMLLE
jgi:hypothetical protein